MIPIDFHEICQKYLNNSKYSAKRKACCSFSEIKISALKSEKKLSLPSKPGKTKNAEANKYYLY